MLSFDKFPLLRIFIPLLSGMFLSTYISDLIRLDNLLTITTISTITSIVTVIYLYCHLKRKESVLYGLSFNAICFIFGLLLTATSIHKAEKEYGNNWRYSIYEHNPFQLSSAKKTQQSISRFLDTHGISGQQGELIKAITIGDKSGITKEMKKDYSKSGISHILALSGFHISIIYMIMQIVFLSRINIRIWKMISQVIIIVLLWTYAFIAGMPPSLVRAIIMCTLLCIGKIYTNSVISINILILSALLMLLFEPLMIFHVGFQLSYVSMLGIYLIGIPLCERYESFCFIDKFLWATICITISCTIFTLPLVSHTFGTIALLSVFTNIIATILTYGIFFFFALWLLTCMYQPITNILLSISQFQQQNASYISNLPFSTLNYTFSLPEIILYYSALALIILIIKNFHGIRN